MYWTEWGLNSRILMGGMDGKNSTALITENIEWPNSLSIDYANNRLYWIDNKLKVIESIRLDGSDRRVCVIFTVIIYLLISSAEGFLIFILYFFRLYYMK